MKKINTQPKSNQMRTSHNVPSGYSSRTYNILCEGSRENLRLTPDLTPLNTGKVLIGSAYQPKPCHVADDQRWLQDALLAKHYAKVGPLPMTLADKVIFGLCALAVVVVWLTR